MRPLAARIAAVHLRGRDSPRNSRHPPVSAPSFVRPELFDRDLGGKPFRLRLGNQARQFGAAL